MWQWLQKLMGRTPPTYVQRIESECTASKVNLELTQQAVARAKRWVDQGMNVDSVVFRVVAWARSEQRKREDGLVDIWRGRDRARPIR